MDMGPCHPLGAIDTACGSASPAWGCWGHGWAPPAPSQCPGCVGAVLGPWWWAEDGALEEETYKKPHPQGEHLAARPCPQHRGDHSGQWDEVWGSPALVGSQNQRDEALRNPFAAARPPWHHVQCLLEAAAAVSHGCAALQEVRAVDDGPSVVYQPVNHRQASPQCHQPGPSPGCRQALLCSQPLPKARSGRTLGRGRRRKNAIDFGSRSAVSIIQRGAIGPGWEEGRAGR